MSCEGSGFHFHFPNDNAKGQFQAAPSLGVLPVNANQRAQGGWGGISGQWKRVGDLSPVSWLQGLAHSRGGVPGSQQPEPHLRLTSLLSSGCRPTLPQAPWNSGNVCYLATFPGGITPHTNKQICQQCRGATEHPQDGLPCAHCHNQQNGLQAKIRTSLHTSCASCCNQLW